MCCFHRTTFLKFSVFLFVLFPGFVFMYIFNFSVLHSDSSGFWLDYSWRHITDSISTGFRKKSRPLAEARQNAKRSKHMRRNSTVLINHNNNTTLGTSTIGMQTHFECVCALSRHAAGRIGVPGSCGEQQDAAGVEYRTRLERGARPRQFI